DRSCRDLLEARYEVPAVPGGKSCRREVLRGLRRFARDPVPRLWRGAHAREEVLRLGGRADVRGQARGGPGPARPAPGENPRTPPEPPRTLARGARRHLVRPRSRGGRAALP